MERRREGEHDIKRFSVLGCIEMREGSRIKNVSRRKKETKKGNRMKDSINAEAALDLSSTSSYLFKPYVFADVRRIFDIRLINQSPQGPSRKYTWILQRWYNCPQSPTSSSYSTLLIRTTAKQQHQGQQQQAAAVKA